MYLRQKCRSQSLTRKILGESEIIWVTMGIMSIFSKNLRRLLENGGYDNCKPVLACLVFDEDKFWLNKMSDPLYPRPINPYVLSIHVFAIMNINQR